MPSFFPEGDAPVATDPSNKSLQKINSLLQSIDSKTGGAGGGGLTNAELRASPVPVDIGGTGSITITSGTVTVSNEVEVTNSTGNPIPVSGPLTDTQLRAIAVPVSGTVTANTGLSQPLTDTQLRATAVPVSGTFWQATQPVSGTVTANTGLSQPLTDAQLRASSVPVSGTVGISGIVPVSGTFWQATQPVSVASALSTRVAGWDIPIHDYRGLGYTSGNLTSVTYKTGGASGTTVATLTLAYDGGGNLTSMTKT